MREIYADRIIPLLPKLDLLYLVDGSRTSFDQVQYRSDHAKLGTPTVYFIL